MSSTTTGWAVQYSAEDRHVKMNHGCANKTHASSTHIRSVACPLGWSCLHSTWSLSRNPPSQLRYPLPLSSVLWDLFSFRLTLFWRIWWAVRFLPRRRLFEPFCFNCCTSWDLDRNKSWVCLVKNTVFFQRDSVAYKCLGLPGWSFLHVHTVTAKFQNYTCCLGL